MTSPIDKDQEKQQKRDNEQRKDERHKVLDEGRVLKAVTYKLCSIHNVRYPEGESCPHC